MYVCYKQNFLKVRIVYYFNPGVIPNATICFFVILLSIVLKTNVFDSFIDSQINFGNDT